MRNKILVLKRKRLAVDASTKSIIVRSIYRDRKSMRIIQLTSLKK